MLVSKEEIKMTIGKRIAQIRILKGYTQKEFADLIKQSDKTVSKWEMDGGEPNTQSIKDICDLYGLSRDYLYDGSVLTEGDRQMEKELEASKNNKLLNEKLETLIKDCEKYLESFGLKMDDDIAPFINKGKIDYNCFIFENGNVKETSFEKLLELKKTKYILKLHKEKVTIKQAIDLDSPDLLEMPLEIFSEKIKKAFQNKDALLVDQFLFGRFHNDPNEYYFRINNVFHYLEELDPKLKNYFKFIVMLIDAGAFYVKKSPYEHVEGYTQEKDVSKTNFYYALAKEHIN
jgi:transcriptional regulator with XRE-family HTH domain